MELPNPVEKLFEMITTCSRKLSTVYRGFGMQLASDDYNAFPTHVTASVFNVHGSVVCLWYRASKILHCPRYLFSEIRKAYLEN